MKSHTQLLTVNGGAQGSWSLTRVRTAEECMSIYKEIAPLEEKLAEVKDWGSE